MTGRRRTDTYDQAELDRKRLLNAQQVIDYLHRAERQQQGETPIDHRQQPSETTQHTENTQHG
jgi:hypothetical protein